MSGRTTDVEIVRRQIAAIEAEMRVLGVWQADPLPPDAFQDMGPFGMNTMSFEQWLQFVFIPGVHERIAAGGPWPQSSQVAVMAMRNFDGWPESATLGRLLGEFDDLFG